MNNRSKGIRGEAIAKTFYVEKGFEILETNFRHGRSEIDLILLKDEEELVFVEVKLRKSNDYGYPESFVSEAQQHRIKEVAEEYILAINWKKAIRFDIACVDEEGQVEVFHDAF